MVEKGKCSSPSSQEMEMKGRPGCGSVSFNLTFSQSKAPSASYFSQPPANTATASMSEFKAISKSQFPSSRGDGIGPKQPRYYFVNGSKNLAMHRTHFPPAACTPE